MFNFDPIAILSPITQTVSSFQTEALSPAAFGRVETKNIAVGTAAGLANPDAGTAAKDGQRYEVGSQTKMMTATVILQLAGEGKIDLDAKASTYLPAKVIEGIANADVVTVRQLLNMTSGIVNFSDVVAPDGQPVFIKSILENPDKTFTPADALNIVRGVPASAEPGKYLYSNTNYNLLGNIIEGVTKQPLASAFETRIFKPAGMSNSDLYGATPPADLVRGFGTGDDGKLFDTTAAKWDKFAEGGVVSTSEDMIKFMKALLVDGKLLPPAQLQEMKKFMFVGETPELKFSFGLGLSEFEIPGAGKFIGFDGGTLGFLSSTYISLATGAIATTAVNYADAPAPTNKAALNLIQLVKDNPNLINTDSFNARSDVLNIKSVSAASAILTETGTFDAKFGDVGLKLPFDTKSITTSNVKFEDESVLVVGDNRVGARRDDSDNKIDILKDHAAAANKNNQILGLGGDDDLRGGRGDDRISGGEGNDFLMGRGGNDTLIGGSGKDYMLGGKGQDTFVFSSLLDSASGRNQRDVIGDFQKAQDKISLAGIDANSNLEFDQAFTFIGKNAFSGTAGELHIVTQNHGCYGPTTIVEGDINGDKRADFQIELQHLAKLDAFDFIL